ncbi:MAG: ATP-binding cassette domain-containing protein [Treponema sp.]|jgi:energy-coupling factor transport system ATP-binding protein|nr:ATP-binding cassette domain-containing protein [Treponema sp.]
MIRIKDLSFRYRGSSEYALSRINVEIRPGDFLGIIGPSGAGKSTLSYGINGLVPHHFPGDFYGALTINGLDTITAGTEAIARQVGSVFQDIDAQMVASVVEDEILFGLENFGVPREEIAERLENALHAAGIADLKTRTIRSLSGGQKQKVAIAAITALRPGIILLDEPTGELDPQSSWNIFTYLKELNDRYGITIIVIEQKILLLCEFVKRLALMDKGALILEGDVPTVMGYADTLKAAGVNIPRVTELGSKLAARAWYQGKLPYTLAQGEVMMRQVLSRKQPAREGSPHAAL